MHAQENPSTCAVCQRSFHVRFRYQLRREGDRTVAVCSQLCHQRSLAPAPTGDPSRDGVLTCEVCDQTFLLEYPFQLLAGPSGTRAFCSLDCRARGLPALPERGPRRLAVFNHKGGTGKTTTAVNLAAGFAERGLRTLLIDADGQGNVGASLGIRGDKTLYHVLVSGLDPAEAAVPVRKDLDVLTSNELLAAAELYLAARSNRHRVLRDRLESLRGYDVVVLDCAPALSLLNQNALVYAEEVLVPVSCDYLSVVGVKQVLRTLKNVRQRLQHPVRLLGVLPTFYDVRNKIGLEAVEALEKHFGERCLAPVRINTRLREAPSAKQTIFEYAPESHGAVDYRAVVERMLAAPTPAEALAVAG